MDHREGHQPSTPDDPRRDVPGGGPGSASAAAPALASGVDLVGELKGSGYREVQHLVRRADGQTFQLTPLLFAVLAAIDGRRTPLQIAWEVASETGRVLAADDVVFLIEERLRPLGLLRGHDGAEPLVTRSSPLLGLRLRKVVSTPRVTHWLTRPVMWLFHPFIVGAVTAGFAAATLWALFERGLGAAVGDAIYQPASVLLVVALTVASAAFHELGHAAACRYGGARPGAMGAALYLVWPVFYTDVTDSYRLSRAGRLRVDLGGLYFNAVFAVATFGAWWVTGIEPLLLVVPVQLFQMVRQLLPVVRFDGYHILADLLGVPDLFHRIKPTLAGLLPSNWGRPETKVLRPLARVVVTGWVLVVVPALAAFFVMAGIALPRVALTAWDSFGVHFTRLRISVTGGELVSATLSVLALFMLLLPPLSMAYLLTSVGRRISKIVWRATDGRPALQGAVALSACALLLTAGSAVWPDRPFVPTDAEAAQPPRHDAPAADAGRLGEQASDAGAPAELQSERDRTTPKRRLVVIRTLAPVNDAAGLDPALVEATPSAGSPALVASRPAWPFPFAPPGEMSEGDNRALAVNTVDGARYTDMSVALVWLSDEDIDQINEAYALASCTGCTTTAAAFHVIFTRGHIATAIPQNVAVAYNQECAACATTAIAMQLVVTLVDEPSAEALAAIEAEWARVQDLEARADRGELDAAEIAAQLAAHRDALLTIVAPYTQLASGEPPADSTSTTSTTSTTPLSGTATTSSSTTAPSASTTSTTVPSTTATTSPSTTSTTSPSTTSTTVPSTTSPSTTSTTSTTSTSTTAPTTTAPEEGSSVSE